MKKFSKFSLLISMLLPLAAFSWDGEKQGYISSIESAPSSTYSFRVYLHGVANMCNATNSDPYFGSFAYINTATPNYNVVVANMLAAKAAGSLISLYTTKRTSNGQTFCEIGDAIVW